MKQGPSEWHVAPCGLCGAKRQKVNTQGICKNCWNGILRTNDFHEPTQTELISILSLKFNNILAGVKKKGFSRRCDGTSKTGRPCERWASYETAAGYFCHIHSKENVNRENTNETT